MYVRRRLLAESQADETATVMDSNFDLMAALSTPLTRSIFIVFLVFDETAGAVP
jgi:hypothetical protein